MTVLAIGAHYDDIELGCCLTLRELWQSAFSTVTPHPLFAVVLTHSGYATDDHKRDKEIARAEADEAFRRQDIQEIKREWQVAPQSLRYSTKGMKALEGIVKKFNPTTALIPWLNDHNQDHRAAAELARTACRHVPTVLEYQSNGYHDAQRPFQPQIFWGFPAKRYAFKTQIMQLYASEWAYRKKDWQRSIFQRDRYWGSLCGADYAEGFQIIRMRMDR